MKHKLYLALRVQMTKAFIIFGALCWILGHSTLALAATPWNGTADVSWYTSNPNKTEYTISTAEQLAGLGSLVNGGNQFYGKLIKLGNDIDLNSLSWIPVGVHNQNQGYKAFNGIFDGGNFNIKGFLINDSDANALLGLFGCIGSDSIIKNLSLAGDITGYGYCGGIVGEVPLGATIYNCTFLGNIQSNGDPGGGGGIAAKNAGDITNCITNVKITVGRGSQGGGIAVSNSGNIKYCSAIANIVPANNVSLNPRSMGGIVAMNLSSGYIVSSISKGDIKGASSLGGVAGYSDGHISNCASMGTITGETFIAGIVGDNYGVIKNCTSERNILGGMSYVGGIAGKNGSWQQGIAGSILNCISTSDIKNDKGHSQSVGGLVGWNMGGALVRDCSWYQRAEETLLIDGFNEAQSSNNVSYDTQEEIPISTALLDVTQSIKLNGDLSISPNLYGVVGAVSYKWTLDNNLITIVGSDTSDTIILKAGNSQGITRLSLKVSKSEWVEPLISECLVLVGKSSSTYQPLEYKILGGIINSISNGVYYGEKDKAIDENYIYSVAGQERIGFTADGNSRLFIRVQHSKPGTISINNMYELLALGIDTKFLSTANLKQVPNGMYQTTLVLTAPESWPDSKQKKINFSVDVRIQTEETNYPIDVKTLSVPILLQKTPVVLVHGLWSDESAFFSINDLIFSIAGKSEGGVCAALRQDGFDVSFGRYKNYLGPNDLILSDNGESFFKEFIEKPLSRMDDDAIECTKVDIVAHSLGGLMAKAFVKTGYYKIASTYRQGVIRRLITLGTPHWGSGFASYLLGDTTYLKRNLEVYEHTSSRRRNTFQVLAVFNKNVASAIDDLALYSKVIRDINKTEYTDSVLMHFIVGDKGHNIDIGFLHPIPDIATNIVELFGINPYTHEDLFNKYEGFVVNPAQFISENSDGTVGISSAQWQGAGLETSSVANKYIDVFPVFHTKMGKNNDIARRVVDLLNGAASAFGYPKSINFLPRKFTSLEFPDIRVNAASPNTTDTEPLTLSSNMQTISPGDSVTFYVTADNDIMLEQVGIIDGEETFLDLLGQNNVFSGTLTIPITFSGVKTFAAIGIANGKAAISKNSVEITVQPDLSDLVSLHVLENPTVTISEGTVNHLIVRGVFKDGIERDLTLSALGTTYVSSNSNIIRARNNGEIEAVTPGEATVTISSGGQKVEIKYTVKPFDVVPMNVDTSFPSDPNPSDPSFPGNPAIVQPIAVSFENIISNLLLSVGDEKLLTAQISPSNATETALTWNVDDPSLITLSPITVNATNTKAASTKQSMKVTAVKEGTTTVTVRTSNGHEATLTVMVTAKDPYQPSFTLDLSDLGLSEGNVLRLNPGDEIDAVLTSNPAGATFKAVGIPDGVTLTTDGHIYGVVPQEGIYPVTIEASLNGVTKVASFTIEVTDKEVIVTPDPDSKKSGSSGGCAVGFGFSGLVLAAAVALILMKFRRRTKTAVVDYQEHNPPTPMEPQL